MAIPIIPLTVEEERSFIRRLKRQDKTGEPLNWGNADYQMRIAADSGGDYLVMTVDPTITDNVMEFDVKVLDNKLKGGRRYYYNIVAYYPDGRAITEIQGTITCKSAI